MLLGVEGCCRYNLQWNMCKSNTVKTTRVTRRVLHKSVSEGERETVHPLRGGRGRLCDCGVQHPLAVLAVLASLHLSPHAVMAAYHLREGRDNNSLWLSFTHRAHMLELAWRGEGRTRFVENSGTAEQIIRN